MKQIIPSEQKNRTLSHIIVVAAGMGMLAILIYFDNIWSAVCSIFSVITPFLIGFGLAFLQLPIVRRVEWAFNKFVFRKKKFPRTTRALATAISLIVLLSLLTAFLTILLPQVLDSIKSLIDIITNFIGVNGERLTELVAKSEFFAKMFTFDDEQLIIEWQNIANEMMNNIDLIVGNVMSISNTIYTTVFQFFVGLITAFYILMDKERFCAQTKKCLYALVSEERCTELIYWTRRASQIFAGFISGKIIDSLIIGFLCYFGMLLCRLEYPVLISVIVGVTNVIPFFGPFIGAIPSILILLIINPTSALIFTIFVLILQQLDGNIIGPLILGDSVGISPLWIMISIVIGGGLFGFVGMLLGVPVFALIYAIIQSTLESRLKERGLPIPSCEYQNAPEELHRNHAEK